MKDMQKHKCQRVSANTGPASWNAKKKRQERVHKRRLVWRARAAPPRVKLKREARAALRSLSADTQTELYKGTLYQNHCISTPLEHTWDIAYFISLGKKRELLDK